MNDPKRLLIIDDDIQVRKIVQLCLEQLEGWHATSCGANIAFYQAKYTTWDAILLEIALLKMDGFTLFNQLQADPDIQSIPIVLLTSKVMPMDFERYQTLNIAGVIHKPFRPKSLGYQVAEILDWTEYYMTPQLAI